MSHHGIKGGYTLARDPQFISVLDVIKASEGPRRGGIHGEHWRHLASIPDYHQLHMVSQLVEGMLRALTIEDVEGKPSSPTDEELSSASHPAGPNTHST
jgi:DNA-binding IscR family transcriptional regulator